MITGDYGKAKAKLRVVEDGANTEDLATDVDSSNGRPIRRKRPTTW